MVAHGTIAFDTLTTSDQVNTGTEKSIDTSYLFNGVAKAWVNLDGDSTAALTDTFNVGSLTDNGTGSFTVTYTNNMGNTTYAVVVGRDRNTRVSRHTLMGASMLGKGKARALQKRVLCSVGRP
jgi:hypothetical protein